MSPTEIIAAKEAFDSAKGIFKRLFGPAIDEYGLMFQDDLRIRRFKNQLKNAAKINKIIEEEGISIKAVNLKALVPYMENVSLEEDESLQDMWANLMVNYLDASKNLLSHVYPGILGQLSSIDVQVLNYMTKHNDAINLNWDNGTHKWDWKTMINLERLSLVREDIDFKAKYEENRYEGHQVKIQQNDTGYYILTLFGSEFMEACTKQTI